MTGSQRGPESRTPLYRAIASDLWEKIQSGQLQPGERLPNEAALSTTYEVNRLTVRQAIIELQRLGALEIRRGTGTFVTAPPDLVEIVATVPRRAQTRDSTQAALADELTGQDSLAGQTALGGSDPDLPPGNPLPTAPLRRVEEHIEFSGPATGAAAEFAAEHLELPVADLLRLDTVMIRGGSAWIVNTYFYPQRLATLAEELPHHGMVVATLREALGLELAYRWRAFSATAADYEEARLLGVATGAALLVRDGVTTDQIGTPVFYVRRRMRGETAKFVLRYES